MDRSRTVGAEQGLFGSLWVSVFGSVAESATPLLELCLDHEGRRIVPELRREVGEATLVPELRRERGGVASFRSCAIRWHQARCLGFLWQSSQLPGPLVTGLALTSSMISAGAISLGPSGRIEASLQRHSSG